MSRKDFIALADVIKSLKGKVDEKTRKEVAEKIAAVCRQNNGEFQFGRFYDAAEISA